MPTNRKSYDYSELVDSFGREKIESRYATLFEYLESFIKRNKYQDNVIIANSVLNQAVVDYFTDIYRLKEFHRIEHINYIKIHAYTAYWILRRKPLQIIVDNEQDIELAFVNEKFVASYLLQFLRGEHEKVVILEKDRQDYIEFVKNMEYFLRYRTITPQMIETMLESYAAGMAFYSRLYGKLVKTYRIFMDFCASFVCLGQDSVWQKESLYVMKYR